MTKGIEWLKEEIGELPCVDAVFNSDGSSYIDSVVPVMAVYDLIDQLDEPEVTELDALNRLAQNIPFSADEVASHLEKLSAYNGHVIYGNQETLSQEWINDNASTILINGTSSQFQDVTIEKLQNLLVPKQELPVIPQFVADWIEKMKQEKRPLYSVMSNLMNKTSHKWAVWKSSNKYFSEVVARAWLDDYTVEKEQKYKVIIKDGEYVRLYLCKNYNVVTIGTNGNYIEKCPEVTYLTEQEIKDYDERYFAFAVPVKEEEE